jgi:hypothetical protein
MKEAILIFIKNAELGKVKTRLAATVGNEKALQIYLALLKHTRSIAQQIAVDRLLFYSSFIDHNDEWPSADFSKHLQTGTDLGQRMINAFQFAFENYEKVLIIGSDCASLTSEIIQKAFDLLEQNDFVIGPAMDGGYYLLGMNKFQPEVFQNIEWSTETVLQSTITQIKALSQSYQLLPELSDIDHAVDWEKYGWDI